MIMQIENRFKLE